MKIVLEAEDEVSLIEIAKQFDVDPDTVGDVLGRKLWILIDTNRPWVVEQLRRELRSITQVDHSVTRAKAASVPVSSRPRRKVPC